MRDPDRIPVVLEALRRTWVKSPDLRLGQIIVNALSNPEWNSLGSDMSDLFAIEDDRLIDAIDLDNEDRI